VRDHTVVDLGLLGLTLKQAVAKPTLAVAEVVQVATRL
jgi:hypothetical protein